ncbi:MAG: glycosyltransferase family 2 protein [Acidimicrobiia bacterium]
MSADCRLAPPQWDASPLAPRLRRRLTVVGVVAGLATALYLQWLLVPSRIGNPALYGVLVVAELFNVAQAVGFWWTCRGRRRRTHRPLEELAGPVAVDVFIPVYGEPVDVVGPTLEAATRMRGADVRVALLDDGGSPEMEALARRHGARYLRRSVHQGAKAGNINHALGRTDAPFVAVFDCDHVPSPAFLERTLGHFADRRVALVQTPQYYANAGEHPVASAAWAQQSLFFGPIARGKDARGAMFCCGTNMVLRRRALEEVGGFPEGSLTEDFELSLRLHEKVWASVYVPEVLASGLGPEDMASYVSQQHRWARGCLGALPAIFRARLPLRLKVQYLLSASYFLTGWTVLVYMALPAVRILTDAQPLADASADQFLVHFAPYFGLALLAVATASAGAYTFAAFSLASATAWVHIHASLRCLRRAPGRFVVTPKHGADGPQPRAVMPALVAMAALVAVAMVGLARGTSPATLNNVAFAGLHVVVLANGVRPALRRLGRAAGADAGAGARAA